MSTEAAFQSGLNAVKAGRFPEAIETLEALCDGKVKPPSTAYYQVKMNLVRAYRGNGQLPEAIKLCRQLSTSSHPQVQQWASKMLPELRNPASLSSSEAVSPVERSRQPGAVAVTERPATTLTTDTPVVTATAPLDQAAAEDLLNQGIQLFRRKQYDSAIAPLNQFVQGADPMHPHLGYAQTSLAKAYTEMEQVEAAIALCKTMLDTPNEGAKAWAQQFLDKHDVQPEPEPEPPSAHASLTPQDEAAAVSPAAQSVVSAAGAAANHKRPIQKDYSVPILSAACYASYYLGLIYTILFPATVYGDGPMGMGPIAALSWGLLNWLGPILVSGTVLALSKNRVARANAKEAINLWITTVLMGLITVVLLIGIVAVIPLVGLLVILLAVPLLLVFYTAPLIALIVCLARPFEPFKIPLIWHIVK